MKKAFILTLSLLLPGAASLLTLSALSFFCIISPMHLGVTYPDYFYKKVSVPVLIKYNDKSPIIGNKTLYESKLNTAHIERMATVAMRLLAIENALRYRDLPNSRKILEKGITAAQTLTKQIKKYHKQKLCNKTIAFMQSSPQERKLIKDGNGELEVLGTEKLLEKYEKLFFEEVEERKPTLRKIILGEWLPRCVIYGVFLEESSKLLGSSPASGILQGCLLSLVERALPTTSLSETCNIISSSNFLYLQPTPSLGTILTHSLLDLSCVLATPKKRPGTLITKLCEEVKTLHNLVSQEPSDKVFLPNTRMKAGVYPPVKDID